MNRPERPKIEDYTYKSNIYNYDGYCDDLAKYIEDLEKCYDVLEKALDKAIQSFFDWDFYQLCDTCPVCESCIHGNKILCYDENENEFKIAMKEWCLNDGKRN